MKNLFLILILLGTAISLMAQHYPKRTPEDIARKQTEMMMRELRLTDSIVRDTLFYLHLKYVHKREISNTRAEAMQYIQDFNAELQHILTPEQYQQFMNQQINYEPHRHRAPYNRITIPQRDTIPSPQGEGGEVPKMPPPPLGNLSPIHL